MRELRGSDLALQWVTVSRKSPLFELRSGDDTIAVMQVEPFRSADANTANRAWHFQPAGLLRRHILITDAGTGQAIATFFYQWPGRGVLAMSDDRRFKWRPEYTPLSLLKGRRLFTLANRPMVAIECMRSMETMCDGMSEEAEITQAGISEPDNLLLLSAGWYVIARKVLEAPDND